MRSFIAKNEQGGDNGSCCSPAFSQTGSDFPEREINERNEEKGQDKEEKKEDEEEEEENI